MSITALSGPIVSFGSYPSGEDYNGDQGPSPLFAGDAILDPRTAYTYEPGQGDGSFTGCFLGSGTIATLNTIPYTAAVAAIAAAANAVANTPVTLVTANSATTGVSITQNMVNAATGVVDTNGGLGLVAIDSFVSVTAEIDNSGILNVTAATQAILAPGMTILTAGGAVTGQSPVGLQIIPGGTAKGGVGLYYLSGPTGTVATGAVTLQIQTPTNCTVPFGNNMTVQAWNPQALLSRAVAITAAAGASGTNVFTVRGYDVYGFPMTETITAAAAAQTVGKKAWKYIKSVTPSATDAHNYSVDTLDIFGFPLRADNFAEVLVNYSASLNPALITANTGFVAADLTAVSATTGDVRGTFAATSATGANRLSFRQTPSPLAMAALQGATAQGIFGLDQYTA